jgi:hypothetical protein
MGLVTRVTRLEYDMLPEMCLCKVVLKWVLLWNFGKLSGKKGYIVSSQNLKWVQLLPLVTIRKGSNFENRFLTLVPTLRPSDSPPPPTPGLSPSPYLHDDTQSVPHWGGCWTSVSGVPVTDIQIQSGIQTYRFQTLGASVKKRGCHNMHRTQAT